MIAQPPIVKIVVPIPPVDGRAESFVSLIEIATETLCSVDSSIVASTPSALIEYPDGAFVSVKWYVPSLRPSTFTVPLVATTV